MLIFHAKRGIDIIITYFFIRATFLDLVSKWKGIKFGHVIKPNRKNERKRFLVNFVSFIRFK